MTFRVEDHTTGIDDVELPRGGRTLPARVLNFAMKKLAERAGAGDTDAGRELLRRCVVGITEEEIDSLTDDEALLIVGHCGRSLAATIEYLKNVEGAAVTETPIPPSAPTTSSSTRSPASPSPTGVRGSRSRTSPSGKRSTPSTV